MIFWTEKRDDLNAAAIWTNERLEEYNKIKNVDLVQHAAVVFNGKKIVAIVLFHDFQGGNVGMTIASDSPKWCSRGRLRQIFDTVFSKWDCRRATAITTGKNQKSRKFLKRLGFRREGIMKKFFSNKEDMYIFGMLKENCKWVAQSQV